MDDLPAYLAWVPPMLGLEDEMIFLGDVSTFSTHYTALINGRRVFVFNAGKDHWFVVLGREDASMPGDISFEQTKRQFMPADSLILLAYIEETSGGNGGDHP